MQDIDIADIRKLTAFIKERYNYDFSNYALSSFKRRILRLMEIDKVPSIDILLKKLESGPSYCQYFVSEITVNVTEMFRDPSFWRVLRDKVLPNILLNHDKVTIWHAGCSSGEEVFSMCILLKEMGILDKSKIIATDLDKDILAKARVGKYLMKNMDLNDKNYIRYQGNSNLASYFKEENGHAILDKSLIETVVYREHDLVQGSAFSKFDLILCRNVMIYFNQSLQNKVLHTLHESLFKYGYLAVGSKESLIWCEIANKFIVANSEEKVYKKVKE